MPSTKETLRAVKTSIDDGNFEIAANKAAELVKVDKNNYTALLFLGLTSDKLDRNDESERAYESALDVKPSDPQALKGLIKLYEKQGSNKLSKYHEVAERLAGIYAEQDDAAQCQNIIDKYELFAKKHGSRAQYREALELMLPTCSLYRVLEGRVPNPAHTYKRLLESAEAEEKEWINSQIGERRTKLGAKLDQVTRQVKFEALGKYQVEQRCQTLINWTQDDEDRHVLEEKLLQRAFDNLLVLPAELKPAQRDKVLTLANGMVIVKHPFKLAWNIALEWVDADSLKQWDVNVLREYIGNFSDDGLSKVLRGFLGSEASPFTRLEEDTKIDDDDAQVGEILSEADALILMGEGLEDSDSFLAHRIVADTYLSLEEWQSAADTARKARKLTEQAILRFSLQMQDSLDAVSTILATALVSHQSPRNHPESRALFEGILQRKPKATVPLLGVGLILEEDEDYHQAVDFLQRASERDPASLRIRLELAWCRALDQDLSQGLTQLEDVLSDVEGQKPVNLVMKSEALYRIAYCKWHIDDSKVSRKDKEGPYKYLIESIKANSSYSPPYTLLGIYFEDYGKSKARARVAFQKAFELSTSELTAAERLAKNFADRGHWDLVELVAQRVVDSGKAKPAPGSKKKTFSWPYAALAVVQMNKQQYALSIVSFQSALRISPEDYHCWVGLGESYHNSGRYVAATRAFAKAESLNHGLKPNQTWFATYMLANVQREMGSFDEAIASYTHVLGVNDGELGVQLALLQTLAESAWAKVEMGMFGDSAIMAARAIEVASRISEIQTDIFNLWKAVGDACSVLAITKAFSGSIDLGLISKLLESKQPTESQEVLVRIDRVEYSDLSPPSGAVTDYHNTTIFLLAAILAHKRAIHAAVNDRHAQAISWYNLGWAEHQAFLSEGLPLCTNSKPPLRFLKAAMRCFKRAIELEAGNAEFWNALAVVTMGLSPKVSQHSFVRSLHLNDNSARTWTNLGALYLLTNDTELANEAFTRAQSADPEYAHAWLGQGFLATMYGNIKEARGLFTHAFEISDSTSLPSKRHYAMSAFEHLLKDQSRSKNAANLLQPLFALHQLRAQSNSLSDVPYIHLSALLAERCSNFEESSATLMDLCSTIQAMQESLQSNENMSRSLQAKAGLARSLLAQQKFDEALGQAQAALDLSLIKNLNPPQNDARSKWSLSAQITAALAHAGKGVYDKAIGELEQALEDSNSDPDIVCLLAKVLWQKGDKGEAQDLLFECAEHHAGHVEMTLMLAAIGLIEGDDDVIEAVESDLKDMRWSSSSKIDQLSKTKIAKVLGGIAACRSSSSDSDVSTLAAMADATKAVMLEPGQMQGWTELAGVTGDAHPAEMALRNARKIVLGSAADGIAVVVSTEDLACLFAGTGKREDALRAVFIAPWRSESWEGLRRTV